MKRNEKIISLSAIGLDAPGLVSKITDRVFKLGGNIVDVEEHCRRGLFAIYLEIDLSGSSYPMDEICQKLKALEEETELKVIVKRASDEKARTQQDAGRYVVTLLGTDRPGIMANVSKLFSDQNINIEHCRMIARGNFFSMEMVIDMSQITPLPYPSALDPVQNMKEQLKELCDQLGQSVVIQEESIYKKMKKLIVFDVESALIQEKSISLFLEDLSRLIGARGKKEDIIIDQKMKGLIYGAKSLQGIPVSELEALGKKLRLNPGSHELLSILKSMGFKVALLSSGLEVLVKRLFEGLDIDYAFANTLKIDHDGIITGELEEPVLTDKTKDEVLEFIMNMEQVDPDQVIAVGDGSARCGFIRNAGLSIAYQPQERPIPTDGILKGDEIFHILYCLGIPKVELDKYLDKEASVAQKVNPLARSA